MTPLGCIAAAALTAALLYCGCGRRLEAGERAPGLVLEGLSGGDVRFDPPEASASPSASLTVLAFVDPAQELSLQALGDLREAIGRVGPASSKVRAIAIAAGAPEAAAVDALRSKTAPGGVLVGALDRNRAAHERYGIIALPTTFVIDGAGAIAAVFPGRSAGYGRRVEAAMRSALALPPAEDPAAAAADTPAARAAARHRKLAEELAAERKFDEAAKQAEAARAAAPDDPKLALLHGDLLVELRDAAGALAAFRRALELAPQSREAKAGLAIAVSLGDDVEAGEKALREVIRVPGAPSAASYHLGLLLERKGDAQGAAAAYREAYERLRRGR